MNLSVSVTGAKEIDQILVALPRELSHQVLGSAHMAAAKPLVEREKLLAPEGPTGNLVDSIGAVRVPLKRANVVGEVIVGPRRGRYKGNHGHFPEFGTKKRSTHKGANRGIMPKHPYAAPAFRQEKGNVERLIAVNVGKSMLRTMKRYAKR